MRQAPPDGEAVLLSVGATADAEVVPGEYELGRVRPIHFLQGDDVGIELGGVTAQRRIILSRARRMPRDCTWQGAIVAAHHAAVFGARVTQCRVGGGSRQ